jgi:hypothetical protein
MLAQSSLQSTIMLYSPTLTLMYISTVCNSMNSFFTTCAVSATVLVSARIFSLYGVQSRTQWRSSSHTAHLTGNVPCMFFGSYSWMVASVILCRHTELTYNCMHSSGDRILPSDSEHAHQERVPWMPHTICNQVSCLMVGSLNGGMLPSSSLVGPPVSHAGS